MCLATRRLLFQAAFVALGYIIFPNVLCSAGTNDEPGGTPEDARLAVQDPDEYAWKLFLFINRQALAGKAGAADPAKSSVRDYDDDRDVVWETWALASRNGKPEAEVFLAQGAKPSTWDQLPRAAAAAPKQLDHTFTTAAHRLAQLRSQLLRTPHAAPAFVMSEPESDEVRMNRGTFDFVRDHELYNVEGLKAAFSAAVAANDREYIQFPIHAKEVKASWKKLEDPSMKNRYHWRTIGSDIYGLVAFHVITKDLPMWFWTDFIHTDLESHEIDPCRDSTTRGANAQHGANGVRNEAKNSKWQYYRLKGTQIAFTDARGNPTRLGNERIENGFSHESSCLRCHAQAYITAQGPNVDFETKVGSLDPGFFGSPDRIEKLQTDFLFSIPMRALSKTTAPTPGMPQAPRNRPITEDSAKKLRDIVEGYPASLAGRIAMRRQQLTAPTANHGPMMPFFVFSIIRHWNPGDSVTVAFRGGSATLHRQIAATAATWSQFGNIKCDFGHDPATGTYRTWSMSDTQYRAMVRVSFDKRGYWSLVGRDSIDPHIVPPNEASMNFEGFDQALPFDWSAVVLHEMGHALGFEHEHQHPLEGCNEDFRWDNDPGYQATTDQFGQFVPDAQGRRPGLYTMLGGPPNKWDRGTIDFNLRSLPNSHAFITSGFDRASIMKYYFPAWMFVSGEASHCYSGGENMVLSALDKTGIAAAYPHAPEDIRGRQEFRKSFFDTLRSAHPSTARTMSHLE